MASRLSSDDSAIWFSLRRRQDGCSEDIVITDTAWIGSVLMAARPQPVAALP